MENFNITSVFRDNYTSLDENAILKMNEICSSGELNNVVVGLEKHCYGLWLIDDEKEIKYQIFYVRGDEKLEGDLIQLTSDLKYRDRLVFYFSNFLSNKYKDIDLIDTFNTFQGHTRGMLEKVGFLTVASTEIDTDTIPTMIAKDMKGIIPIRIIQKGEFYKKFFGNKNLPNEKPRRGYVYLMLDKRSGYIKIGKSKEPTFREKTLHAQEPDIELIAFWEAPSIFEKQLHKQFELKRQRGEWFALNFEDLKQIKEIMDDYQKKGTR